MGKQGIEMSSSDWSWEENKKFEMALAVMEEDDPEKWKKIASAIGGKRSIDEIEKHYKELLKDLELIESGVVAYEFVEKADDCSKDAACSENNYRLPLQLRLAEDCFPRIMEELRLSKMKG